MYLRIIIVCISLLFSCESFSQRSSITSFKKLSKPEKHWVIFHPFVAKKALLVTRIVIMVSDSIAKANILDGDVTGGQVDAFRHCYWMAMLSNKISVRKAFKLGLAHEKGNYLQFKKGMLEDGALPDSLSSQMDLENNGAGIELGVLGKGKENVQEYFKQFVIDYLRKGMLVMLKKDREGDFLTCSGEIINMVEWKGKWGIPKCLIRTNEH